MKIYAELIGNYERYRIKSRYDNKLDGFKFTAGINPEGLNIKGVESMVKSYKDIIGTSPAFSLGQLNSHESAITGIQPAVDAVKSARKPYEELIKSIGNTLSKFINIYTQCIIELKSRV